MFGVVIHKKRRSAYTKVPNVSTKSPKLSTSSSLSRLYFKWRGRKHGDGAVAYNFYKKNAGYLQFADLIWTKFEITIFDDFVENNFRF